MSFYLDDAFRPEMLELVAGIRSEEYYSLAQGVLHQKLNSGNLKPVPIPRLGIRLKFKSFKRDGTTKVCGSVSFKCLNTLNSYFLLVSTRIMVIIYLASMEGEMENSAKKKGTSQTMPISSGHSCRGDT